ncbi:MAG: ABC transporter ATP-binding protein [Azospirillum sp.]|nr:ABC transporter ATP-binding protein [Azospirillum sp.]MCA3264691.1 ABC transporter ATP-binding protein [Azospirillum sp.]
MSALVEMRGVGMTYGSGEAAVTALSDVSLDIRRGEILMLMGPSGSGKTTLLQIAGALLAPTAGEVRLMGASIAGLSQDKRGALRLAHFGFVFQSYNLFPTLTARQNVELALDLRGTAAADRIERASAALARVGLGDRADHYPAQLSGGQKQRVAIARALAGAPDVVFADEPTAALDSESGKRVVALLHDLAKAQNRAVVVVTHDPRIVDAADRIVHIEDGRIGRVEARATVEA